jgi:type IX secretion system PorP/SprF family membrane protein
LKRIICHIFVFYFTLAINGQDMHFSQFTEPTALVNPALTGAIAKLRCTAVNRRQWNSLLTPYSTFGASFEIRSPGRLKRTGKFGRAKKRTPGLIALGIAAYPDNAGNSRLKTTSGIASLTTFVPAGKRNFFTMGLQASLVQKQLGGDPFIYPDQFTGTGYDPSLIKGEDISNLSFQYTDFAAGVLWSYGADVKNFLYHMETKIRLGFSAFHLTRPAQAYFNGSTDLANYRYVVHGEMLRDIEGTHTAIAPSFIVQMQGPSREIAAGSLFKYYNSNDTKITGFVRRSTFGMGLYYRYMDALIFLFQAELEEQYTIGISYDLIVSSLRNYGKRGGLEITLRYTPANPYLYQKR